MDRQRLLELALHELQRQKTGINEEIETLQNELKGAVANFLQMRFPTSAGTQRKRERTPAERKAQAQRMRAYWAQKKAQTKPTPARANLRTKTAAQKKALSLAMKEAWKRRKAAAKEAPAN